MNKIQHSRTQEQSDRLPVYFLVSCHLLPIVFLRNRHSKALFECAGEVGADYFACYVYHISESEGMGYTVADDNRAVNAKYGGAAIKLKVEMIEEWISESFLVIENVVNRFRHFKGYIPYKALAYYHFRL